MTSSTTATLECAAQARTAPKTMLRTGMPRYWREQARALGAFSAGASESSRMCSDSSIRPRPIATRPRSRIRVRVPYLNAMTPMPSRNGANRGTIETE